MEHYLNQAEYTRWVRHYQMTMENYLRRLDTIHQRIDNASEEVIQASPGTKERIEQALDTIEARIGEAIPRDFSPGGKPLEGSELFTENMKILANLIYKMLHKPIPCKGIYETERERVQQVHQVFKFKEKMVKLQAMVHAFIPEENPDNTQAHDLSTDTEQTRENISF